MLRLCSLDVRAPLMHKCLLIGFSLCLWCPTYAQDESIRFQRLSLNHGLSQTTVNDIAQSEQGYIWIATQDGLNRYDGYDFKVYSYEADRLTSLSDNHVQVILSDPSGDLWLGTPNGGLNRYIARIDAFERIDLGDICKDIRGLAFDKNGHLWISSYGSGLLSYDPDTKRSRQIMYRDPGWGTDRLGELIFDREGQLWVATQGGGVCRFDPKSGQIVKMMHRQDDTSSLSSGEVMALLEDDQGRIWIGCHGGGLNLWQPKSGSFQHFSFDANRTNSLAGNDVNDIFQDSEGWIWVSTRTGLSRTKSLEDGFLRYEHDPTDDYSLPHDIISVLSEDRTGSLWVGTLGAGVAKWNRNTTGFRHYRYIAGHDQSLSSNSVWSIRQDKIGDLWVGTSRGLNWLDQRTGKFMSFRHDPEKPDSISSDIVRAVYVTSDSRVWAGSDGSGVSILNLDRKSFSRLKHQSGDDSSLPNDAIRCFLETNNGQFWVGTYGGGLCLFDPVTEEFETFCVRSDEPDSISDDRIYSLVESQDGKLWVGTHGGGLNLFDPVSARSIRYQHDPSRVDTLSSNGVLGVTKDSVDRIWVCTSNGLNLFKPDTHTFDVYHSRDGLPNNVVYGILEDAEGFMWMSTNNGLARLNPASGAFRTFHEHDGLQSNEFNGGAYFKSSDGTLFFGGIAGFNAFDPLGITVNDYPPQVVITDLKLFNRSVRPDPTLDSSILHHAIGYTDGIVFDHRQSMFALEFAALHYADPKQNRYAYRMEGLDNDWIETNSQRRFVSYNRLAPGDYRFHVIASNNAGVWNRQGKELSIRILPPPWLTWWAYLFYLTAFLALAVGLPAWRIRSLQKQERLLRLLVNARTSDLSERNKQLETLDKTVHAINRETKLSELLDTLLEQSLALISRACSGLITLNTESGYRVMATRGQLDEVVGTLLDEADCLKRFLPLPSLLELGVYLSEQSPTKTQELILAIMDGDVVKGFLAMQHAAELPFGSDDVDRLMLLRGHVVTAIEKSHRIQRLDDTAKKLKQTQQELMEAAHLAGMAEIAENVLHNIGNSLNSIHVSLDVANDLVIRGTGPQLISKVAELLDEHREQLDVFLTAAPKGQRIVEALPSLVRELDQNMVRLGEEIIASSLHVTKMTEIVRSQHRYAAGDSFVRAISINDLLEDVLHLEEQKIHQLNIQIIREFNPVPHLNLSKTKLIQVVINLVNNACEALSEVTDRERRIIVSTKLADECYVRIDVADNGPGVANELWSRVFSPGYSSKSRHRGMGLHYCATCISDMRGRILLRPPESGQGVIFSFFLPIQSDPALSGNPT